MQLPRRLEFGKRVVTQLMDDEVPDLAAGLAYRFLFAVFPFGIFLAALAAFVAQWFGVADPSDEIIGALGDNLPGQVAEQIAPQLETVLGRARPGLLSLGAIGALWAATGGVSSLISAMNRAYGVHETRPFFVKTGLAILLTMIGSGGILIGFVTIVGGSVITEQVIEGLGVPSGTWQGISMLRYPLMLVLVALAVAALFRFGPNVAVSFRWTLVGGIVFALGWLLATALFGLYVGNFGSYANTYGALGGVIILMLWFYISALMLLVAAEVTSVLANDHEPERVQARRTETELGRAAKEAAKAASRGVGVVAGTVVGVAEAVIGLDDETPSTSPDDEPDGTAAAPTKDRPPAPVSRIPRREAPATYRTFEPRPSRLFALVVFVVGGIVGAIAGLLADDDEDAATG